MTSATSGPALSTTDSDSLRARIDHFYARQMHALDDNRPAEWAATFTDDGVFAVKGQPEPTRGRAALTAAAAAVRDQLAADGVMHRHWLGMLSVDPRSDGTVLARFYALVIATPRDGAPCLHRSTCCADVLVGDGEGWLVRERQVERDDLI